MAPGSFGRIFAVGFVGGERPGEDDYERAAYYSRFAVDVENFVKFDFVAEAGALVVRYCCESWIDWPSSSDHPSSCFGPVCSQVYKYYRFDCLSGQEQAAGTLQS